MPQPTSFYGGIDPLLPSEIKPVLYHFDEYQTYDLLWIDQIDKRIANIFSWANQTILKEVLQNQRVLIERFFPYQNIPHADNYGVILFNKLKLWASSDWCCPEPLWDTENSQIFNYDIPESAIISGSNLGSSNAGNLIFPKVPFLNAQQTNNVLSLFNYESYFTVPDKNSIDANFIWISYLVFDVRNNIAEYIFVVDKLSIKEQKYNYNFLPYVQPWSLVVSHNNEDISAIIGDFQDNQSNNIQNLFYFNMENRLDQIIALLSEYFEDSIGKVLKSFDCSINISLPEWENNYYGRFYSFAADPNTENDFIIPDVTVDFSDFEYIDYPAKKYAYIFANNPDFIAEDIIEGEVYFNKNNNQIFIDFYPFESAYKFTFLDYHHPEIFPFGYYEWSFSGAGKDDPSWLFDANNPEFSFLMGDIPNNEQNQNQMGFFQYSFSAHGAYRNPGSAFTSKAINDIIPNALGLILDIPIFSGMINWWDSRYYPGQLLLPYHFNEFRLNPLSIHRAFRNTKYCSIFEIFTDINPCGLLLTQNEDNTEIIAISLIDTNTKSILATGTNSVSWSGRINRILKSGDSTNKEYEISFIEQTTSSGNIVFYPTPELIMNAIDAKYYNPQFLATGEHNYTMPDSIRLKEIHASLNADKFSKDDNDPSKARVANLGYLLERVARVLGISVNSDGSIRSIRQKRHIAVDSQFVDGSGQITFPAGWSFGQFAINYGGGNEGQIGGNADEERDGIIYEVRSNYFNDDKNPDKILEGGYLLCENWPQYFDSLLDDLDKALGWNNAGANVLPNADNTELVKFEGLQQLLYEIAYMLGDLSRNIKQTHILSSEMQAEIKEIIGQFGLPTTIKSKDIEIGDIDKKEPVIGKLPYVGFNKNAPTLYQLITLLLINLSLVNNSVLTANLNEESLG